MRKIVGTDRVIDGKKKKIMDKKEQINFHEYLNKNKKLQESGILNYHNLLANNPNDIIKQSKFTKFTEPLYHNTDYQTFKNKFELIDDLKSDLDLFENYSNFGYSSIDSVKFKYATDEISFSKAST